VEKLPIHQVSFPTQHLLASTFLRFQEHYESPEFAGKAFDWETFMDWYAAGRGSFSYMTDWTGFNVPSRVFVPFREGKFDPLTRKESWLLSLFENVADPFYVIGTYDGGEEDLAHEVVHGLYTVFPDYGASVRDCLSSFPLPKFRAGLAKMGYGDNVIDDESNAYLLTGLSVGLKGLDAWNVRRAKAALHALFTARFGLDLRKRRDQLSLGSLVHGHRYEP